MKYFDEQIKKLKQEKKRSLKVPVKIVIPINVYLAHTDKQKNRFEQFCIDNKIELEIK